MTKKIGIVTASAVVVANMIGTGVFTSVGYQLSELQNTWTIMLLWVSGGLLSLFGAFAYSELGTHFPASGGDYVYLSRVFHPLAGYLSGWTGLTVGFSAPVALAAMAFTRYLSPFGLGDTPALAIAVILLITIMHSISIKQSSRFHNSTTLIKVLFLIVLIIVGLLLPQRSADALLFDGSWKKEVVSTGFAVSMIYVSYAYTGWNAAAYITGEIEQPRKNLPRSLIMSTLFVSLLYVLFQFVLLKHAGVSELQGREDVAYISFSNLLGGKAAQWISLFIAFQLLATISSYQWVGPRVTWAMATEHRLWKRLAWKNVNGIPVAALWTQAAISILLTLTGSFEQVLLYCGFVLQFMANLTVATSLFLKPGSGREFRSPLRPWLQIIFLLFNTAVLIFTYVQRPKESLLGLGLLGIGVLIYLFDRPAHIKPREETNVSGIEN